MVGITTRRDPDGLELHFTLERTFTYEAVSISIFLSKDDCKHIKKSINEAIKEYWSK